MASKVDLTKALLLAIIIRITVVILGVAIDERWDHLQFTDVDYLVYTDAADHILHARSPYERPSYRYPPFLAYLLQFNMLLLPCFGKVLFSLFDVASIYETYKLQYLCKKHLSDDTMAKEKKFWLYVAALNPVAICLAARGSSDSISNYLLLATLHLLLTRHITFSAILYGCAVYFRLYPVIFFPAFLFYLHQRVDMKRAAQFLILALFTLWLLTYVSFFLYGYDYIYHSILYHFQRSDHRHNFSAHFYPIYLQKSQGDNVNDTNTTLLSFFPPTVQIALLLVIAYIYSAGNLAFCLFLQTAVFVTWNKVITAQYFVWYLTFLPLLLRQADLLDKSLFAAIALLGSAGAYWLYNAYGFEFVGKDNLDVVWLASLVFAMAHMFFIMSMIVIEDKQSAANKK